MVIFKKIFLLRSILLSLTHSLTKYKSATGGVADANTEPNYVIGGVTYALTLSVRSPNTAIGASANNVCLVVATGAPAPARPRLHSSSASTPSSTLPASASVLPRSLVTGLPTVRARTNTKEDELVQGRKGGIGASAAKCSGLMSSHQAAELGVKRARGRSGK
ncbi:hypothetical protein B0H14DRAFT_2558754 [Mycena olivaceomarginata]|nr:hypothetical protein B0H14DRAFT_2558754 [Mycena olivaceomarginata]